MASDEHLSYELIDHLRNLCLAVSVLASRSAVLIGTDAAGEAIDLAYELIEYLDGVEVAKGLPDDY